MPLRYPKTTYYSSSINILLNKGKKKIIESFSRSLNIPYINDHSKNILKAFIQFHIYKASTFI